ncbi:site-specific DNA recombinase [Kitasatospora sp. MAA19]|uniref:recombinase family protein n=1 Tax=Kitasatospora sp. MAA19 TaxID=3035090 RepID=UPI0024765324|nr:recombinase family protein [Kitasatospora sp. MAA19]MDH6709807.1 site-specific DNA recombinase [Kitasatospora sp. MAA19]
MQASHESNPQLRAFLYARNSRGGKSTKAQLLENRRECEARGWQNAGEFEDANRSASRYAKRIRENFEDMVARVHGGEADVIISCESSRLQRDLEVYVMIRRLCVETHTLWCYGGAVYDMSRPQDRNRTALDAVQSESELDVIRERNLRTVRLNAESMRPHGRVLTGYVRRYDPETGDLIDQVPDETWAPLVQRVFREFVSGITAHSIARGLQRDGLLTSTGREWRDTGIVAMLKTPGYAGYRVFQGKIIGKGAWDPLIDDLTWRQAQMILNDRSRKGSRTTAVVNELSGIPSCSGCTGTVQAVGRRSKRKYGCRTKFCASIGADVMEAYVEERLVRWLGRPDTAAAFQDPARNAEVEEAVALVAKLAAELNQARAAAKTGALSVASLIAVEAGLLPRLADAQAAAEACTTASPLLVSLLGRDDVEARWGALTLEQRRAVLREVATITLHPALRRGDSTLYEGRIVMTLGPRRPGQSSDAASAASSIG